MSVFVYLLDCIYNLFPVWDFYSLGDIEPITGSSQVVAAFSCLYI